jgi:hypothetical protein
MFWFTKFQWCKFQTIRMIDISSFWGAELSRRLPLPLKMETHPVSEILFSSYLEFRMMHEIHKPCDSEQNYVDLYCRRTYETSIRKPKWWDHSVDLDACMCIWVGNIKMVLHGNMLWCYELDPNVYRQTRDARWYLGPFRTLCVCRLLNKDFTSLQ